MIVLGIETSCDETAAAVVDRGRCIRADLVLSQIDLHRIFGGVVPEVAARSHITHLDRLIAGAMDTAGIGFGDLDAVAATAGPGLIGALMVGLVTGKAIAAARRLPFVAVNHLEGHALSVRLAEEVAFPYLLLLASGGHCQLLAVEGVGRYERLGTTIDDAVGEAFDKAARALGLGYPGGPAIERAAREGDPGRFRLPRPMRGRAGADFSFSGLKTALARLALRVGGAAPGTRADLAAAFQAAVTDVLEDRTANAAAAFRDAHGPGRPLVLAGGVAANEAIRARLRTLAAREGMVFVVPPARLCTDNAAMIAWAGIERLALGLADDLGAPARARWPLDEAAGPAPGTAHPGRLGARA